MTSVLSYFYYFNYMTIFKQPSLPLSVSAYLYPPIFLKHVSTQLRIINLFCGRGCCTLLVCLKSTQTTAGSLMVMLHFLAASQATLLTSPLYNKLHICCIHNIFTHLHRLADSTQIKKLRLRQMQALKTHPSHTSILLLSSL